VTLLTIDIFYCIIYIFFLVMISTSYATVSGHAFRSIFVGKTLNSSLKFRYHMPIYINQE